MDKTLELFTDLKNEFISYVNCIKKIKYRKGMNHIEYNQYIKEITDLKLKLNSILRKIKRKLQIYDLTEWL